MATLSAFPAMNLLGNASSSISQTYAVPSSSVNAVGPNMTITADYRSALFFLNVVQTPAASSAFCDVFVQHSADGGTTFDDFIHFATITGKGTGPAKQIAQWIRDVAPSSSATIRVPQNLAIAQSTILQGPTASLWKATAVVTVALSSSQWQLTLQAQVAQ